MPARINNLPAYSVYDLSHKQSVTPYTDKGTQTITGTTSNIKDKDLTTYYEVKAVYAGGGNPVIARATIDYGAIYFNCQLYTKYHGDDAAFSLEISDNGTDWTEIGNTNGLNTVSGTLMSLRYVRFTVTRVANADTFVRIYECRLMGS